MQAAVAVPSPAAAGGVSKIDFYTEEPVRHMPASGHRYRRPRLVCFCTQNRIFDNIIDLTEQLWICADIVYGKHLTS